MGPPLVSIVTPCFNAARFIAETIESVKEQDYPWIEHLVFDGGSTDGTQDILARYAHLQWVSEPDRGQSHALNKGFQTAKGDIIGWLNADDTYQPGAIKTAVDNLLATPEVDLVYSDIQIIDEQNRTGQIRRSQPFSFETYFDSSYIKQPTVFMRKRVIEVLGGVDERLHYVMDRELWLRAGLYFKMLYLPGIVLANFRFASGSKSFQSAPDFHTEWLRVLECDFQTPAFEKIPADLRAHGLNKTREICHISHFIQACKTHDRINAIRNLCSAISVDWKLIVNRGIWGFLADGILGTSLMKNRRPYGLPPTES